MGMQSVPAGSKLLGTLVTTTGTTHTLSGLSLSGFNFLYCFYSGVSCATTSRALKLDAALISEVIGLSDSVSGLVIVDLETGKSYSMSEGALTDALNFGSTALNRSSSSVSFSWNGSGNFDAGSINVYGVR